MGKGITNISLSLLVCWAFMFIALLWWTSGDLISWNFDHFNIRSQLPQSQILLSWEISRISSLNGKRIITIARVINKVTGTYWGERADPSYRGLEGVVFIKIWQMRCCITSTEVPMVYSEIWSTKIFEKTTTTTKRNKYKVGFVRQFARKFLVHIYTHHINTVDHCDPYI